MTTRGRPTRYRVLDGGAEDALLAIHQHRLLTTSQVWTLVLPDRSIRRTQAVLADLARRGLVAAVTSRRPWPGPAQSVWFLTKHGADAAQAPDNAEPRYRPLRPEQAAGPLQAHTLAVNDVGLAFTRAAREEGDEFDSRSWRHEIVHDYRTGRHQRRVVTDAVLTYSVWPAKGQPYVRFWFLELDRGNSLAHTLAGRLSRYADLLGVWSEYRATDYHDKLPVWPSWYSREPQVMVVFAGSRRGDAAGRRRNVMRLCERRGEFRYRDSDFDFVLLDDLIAAGPLAPIVRRLSDARRYDCFGQAAEETEALASSSPEAPAA
jgi:hypothetical protein